MLSDAIMLGDGAVVRDDDGIRMRHKQIAELETQQREIQRLLQTKSNEVFKAKWDLFMACAHDWVVDRDDITIYPGSPQICTRCGMYEHGPRKQFF